MVEAHAFTALIDSYFNSLILFISKVDAHEDKVKLEPKRRLPALEAECK